MNPELFNQADYAEVRSRVLGEIRRRRLVRTAMYAAAAAVVILACGLWAWRISRVEPAPPAVARVLTPAPPALEAPTPITALPVRHPARRVRPRPAPEPKREEPVEPLLVKLETPDPDVVIYWIVEGKGD
jgi:hypothetical protein